MLLSGSDDISSSLNCEISEQEFDQACFGIGTFRHNQYLVNASNVR